MMILVDSSSSLQQTGLEVLKDFIYELTGHFDIDNDMARVSSLLNILFIRLIPILKKEITM